MEAQPMRLQDLRLKEGMSLEQLAELSGVDHDRLVMFENNPETIRNMHLDTARQIAKALHCNVLELHPDEGWRGGIHCAESGLRDIRRTRGYTQNELSEMTGIPQPNISWFETGYRSTSGMRLDNVRDFAHFRTLSGAEDAFAQFGSDEHDHGKAEAFDPCADAERYRTESGVEERNVNHRQLQYHAQRDRAP